MTATVGVEASADIYGMMLEESVLEIPCDYGDDAEGSLGTHSDPARWVLTLMRCPCGAGGQTLACDRCKRLRLESTDAAVVCAHCGDVTAPARLAYSHVEAL
ncbi:MAG TPA: hypothetical protein VJW23_10085 [Propionibacteriaceae bacterium]|nr:hypothetical protein [Propionibacteriaceae bacterium]